MRRRSVQNRCSSVFEHLPVLGAGLGYQDELHQDIVAHRDAIDFLEVPTDQFLRQMPEWHDRLLELKGNFSTVAHGVYMSLGDASGAHVDYLDRLIPYLDTLDPVWFSDHIDMGNIPEDELGMYFHGMQVPFTHEQAAVFRHNMQVFSERVRRPLLVENIFYKFVFPMPNGLSEPAFIGEILKDSEWGLLLDVTNVYINALNFGFDPYAWLEQAPLERTVEIHVAGGELRTSGTWEGKWADTHSQPVPDASGACWSTWWLALQSKRCCWNATRTIHPSRKCSPSWTLPEASWRAVNVAPTSPAPGQQWLTLTTTEGYFGKKGGEKDVTRSGSAHYWARGH